MHVPGRRCPQSLWLIPCQPTTYFRETRRGSSKSCGRGQKTEKIRLVTLGDHAWCHALVIRRRYMVTHSQHKPQGHQSPGVARTAQSVQRYEVVLALFGESSHPALDRACGGLEASTQIIATTLAQHARPELRHYFRHSPNDPSLTHVMSAYIICACLVFTIASLVSHDHA